MEEKEYKEFLEYLFYEYIEKKLRKIERYYHPKELFHWNYEMQRLFKASAVTKFIRDNCDEDIEIYEYFKLNKLKNVIYSVEDGVRMNNRLVVETGIIDVIEEYFDEIIDGMKTEYFPEKDFTVLRQIGSSDPKLEITTIILLIKKRKDKDFIFDRREISYSKRLKNCVDILSSKQKELKEQEEAKEEKENQKREVLTRRWFKGLGQICKGAIITITDISLMAGWLPFPVSVETRTVGSIVSATAGIGEILMGIGDLRNE